MNDRRNNNNDHNRDDRPVRLPFWEANNDNGEAFGFENNVLERVVDLPVGVRIQMEQEGAREVQRRRGEPMAAAAAADDEDAAHHRSLPIAQPVIRMEHGMDPRRRPPNNHDVPFAVPGRGGPPPVAGEDPRHRDRGGRFLFPRRAAEAWRRGVFARPADRQEEHRERLRAARIEAMGMHHAGAHDRRVREVQQAMREDADRRMREEQAMREDEDRRMREEQAMREDADRRMREVQAMMQRAEQEVRVVRNPLRRLFFRANNPVDAGNDAPAILDVFAEPLDAVAAAGSRYLYDLVREDVPCAGLRGGGRCCNLLVTQCEREPQSLAYRCSQWNRTPLHEAASRCLCTHVMEAFVQHGASHVNSVDGSGNTPLHLLFLGMPKKAVEPQTLVRSTTLLLPTIEPSEENPVPGLPSNTAGDTALHVACKVPQSFVPEETVDILIAFQRAALLQRNTHRQTPLHLHCARRNATVGLAEKLANVGVGNSFTVDSYAKNPLHYVASQSSSNGSSTELICWLVAFDSHMARELSGNEQTALHLLCAQRGDRMDAVRALLEAYPEAAARRDGDRAATPLHLHLATARTPDDVSLELVELLAPHCALLANAEGYLPLHVACQVGAAPEVVAALVSLDAAQARTHKGDTALSIACTANVSPETVLQLLAIHPAAAQVSNQYGFLPLHAVCRAYHPNVDILQQLVAAYPAALHAKTNAGETPLHLAHHGASRAVLRVLSTATSASTVVPTTTTAASSKTKLGNTPLHSACLHTDVAAENIENMASDHPEWIVTKNKNGLTPLQILCRYGRINESIVHTFYRLAGSSIFSEVDEFGHTALHSAMREEMEVPVIRALIDSYPMALRMCTQYGDTPLHLACCRGVKSEVVAEVAQSSCARATQLGFHVSPLLLPNKGSQTSFQLAMEEYRRTGFVCPSSTDWGTQQNRCFEILVSLVKILYYGPDKSPGSLVFACVALHRKGARLDPTFIHQVIKMYPEEVREVGEDGCYPLHIEAGIPIEKFVLLDGSSPCSCRGTCHQRASILQLLMDLYPDAAKTTSAPYPVVTLMIQNGRRWDDTFASVVRTNPGALLLLEDRTLLPYILAQVGRGCGMATLYSMIRANPGALR